MSENITMIVNQYIGAIKKHPFFAHKLIDECNEFAPYMSLRQFREALKDEIAADNVAASTVLACELQEAIIEITQGNHQAALTELAQCGAVILRMMDMVRTEMEEEVTP